jgi:hypothetical protein
MRISIARLPHPCRVFCGRAGNLILAATLLCFGEDSPPGQANMGDKASRKLATHTPDRVCPILQPASAI